MVKNIAAIDIGTHTARLLIAEARRGEPFRLSTLARERAYTRLADRMVCSSGKKSLDERAAEGLLKALSGFLKTAGSHRVEALDAVATGIFREVENGGRFLKRIQEITGIPIRLIDGGEEARLTEKGVLHALPTQASPFLIFDLGGGSTEFALREGDARTTRSISVGAAALTRRFFSSDPPLESELEETTRCIDRRLEEAFPGLVQRAPLEVIGTGGTVVTLASALSGISLRGSDPGGLNGWVLKGAEVEALFHRLKGLDAGERLRLFELDRGRADVVLAGALGVVRILRFFRATRCVASASDLLEGLLLEMLERGSEAGVGSPGAGGLDRF